MDDVDILYVDVVDERLIEVDYVVGNVECVDRWLIEIEDVESMHCSHVLDQVAKG